MSGRASGVNSPESLAGRRPESCCGGEGSCAPYRHPHAPSAANAITTCLTPVLPRMTKLTQPPGLGPESWSSYTPMKRMTKSQRLFARALDVLPGGVDSPVRAFKSVGGTPLFIRRAAGATIEDVDGNRYIDYVMSWGPLIHGHAPRGLVKAIDAAAKRGTSFGAPSPLENRARRALVRTLVPSMERVRFVSSGTEATMSAVRVARAFTGRDRIIKFEGCYHGHGDAFLVKAGSGATTLGIPTSPGVPASVAADTLLARYNDLESVSALCRGARRHDRGADCRADCRQHGRSCRPPTAFSRACASSARVTASLLIFDEVISGFPRVGGRRTGALRHPARPHVPRQDHRRRPAGRRVRRPRGHHGAWSRPPARCIRRARCPEIRSR